MIIDADDLMLQERVINGELTTEEAIAELHNMFPGNK